MTVPNPTLPHLAPDAGRPQPDPPGDTEPRQRLADRPRIIQVVELRGLPPTLDIETAAAILGCGRTLAYDLVRRGEFPCRVLRLGRRYLIPTSDLLKVVGLDAPDDQVNQ